MPRKRFKWTRSKYEKADHLARFYARHIYDFPDSPPMLLQRFWDLWERHRQNDDPLLTPLRFRHDTDDIPF